MILSGQAEIRWNGQSEKMHRDSLFDENPYCLHVPRNTKVTMKADTAAEVLIQKTDNEKDFAPKFYRPEDVQADIPGVGAEVKVRVFDRGHGIRALTQTGDLGAVNTGGRKDVVVALAHIQTGLAF